MAARDLLEELGLGAGDVEQGLTLDRFGLEGDEVDRMAGAQRDTDLGVRLEAADAGAMAGARVDDHDRPPRRIHHRAIRRQDAQQRVIAGLRQVAAVDQQLMFELQQRRLAGAQVVEEHVAAFPHRVQRQQRTLPGIRRVVLPVVDPLSHSHAPAR